MIFNLTKELVVVSGYEGVKVHAFFEYDEEFQLIISKFFHAKLCMLNFSEFHTFTEIYIYQKR